MLALVVLAVPPILTNAYVGGRRASTATPSRPRAGMGMTRAAGALAASSCRSRCR